jgi:hypothetical protein
VALLYLLGLDLTFLANAAGDIPRLLAWAVNLPLLAFLIRIGLRFLRDLLRLAIIFFSSVYLFFSYVSSGYVSHAPIFAQFPGETSKGIFFDAQI